MRLLLNQVRQIVETVNSQLAGRFGVETNRAHTFLGLSSRLHSKLAAHTLCIYLNRMLGERHFLRIKRLAFNIWHNGLAALDGRRATGVRPVQFKLWCRPEWSC